VIPWDKGYCYWLSPLRIRLFMHIYSLVTLVTYAVTEPKKEW